MRTFFLQSQLKDYTLSYLENLPLLTSSSEKPAFCLLPKFLTFKKARKLASLQTPNLVWILPIGPITSYLVSSKLLKILQPLYFLSDQIYDRRYLQAKGFLYKLPQVNIDISVCLFKTAKLEDKEKALFYPKRAFSFYFKGDTTDRIQNPAYLKTLEARQAALKKPALSFVYLFLKKVLDV